MSERRRFFPAIPVQQVPGRTVELEVQLRQLPGVAAPAPGAHSCDVTGATWLMSITGLGEDAGWSELPDGQGYQRTGYSNGMGCTSIWEGTPGRPDTQGPYLEGPNFRCVFLRLVVGEWDFPPLIVGVLQGRSLCDVHWELSWSHPGELPGDSLNGGYALTEGNMIWVRPYLSGAPIHFETETLTASACCGGAQVGELILEVITIEPA